MASKDPNMSKQGAAGKRKHITLWFHSNLKQFGGQNLVKAA